MFLKRGGHVSTKSLELLDWREALLDWREAFGVLQGPPNFESRQPGCPPSWHKARGRVGRLCISPWCDCKCVWVAPLLVPALVSLDPCNSSTLMKWRAVLLRCSRTKMALWSKLFAVIKALWCRYAHRRHFARLATRAPASRTYGANGIEELSHKTTKTTRLTIQNYSYTLSEFWSIN
jgi:hypothetical protein